MMIAIDRIAHLNRWRSRSLAEKALLAIGMLLLTLTFPSYPVTAIVVVVMMAATLVGARVPVRIWLACAVAPVGFLFFSAAFLAVQVDAGGVMLTSESVSVALKMLARALAGLSCFLFLALTTPTTDLLVGLRRLGIPRDVVEIALLMYRFIFLLADSARNMGLAQAARLGHSTKRRRLRSLGLLVANLLPRAMDRGRRLETGLAARGWTGEMRVLSRAVPFSLPAFFLILFTLALTAGAGVLFS